MKRIGKATIHDRSDAITSSSGGIRPCRIRMSVAILVLSLSLSACETISVISGTLSGRDAKFLDGGAVDIRFWDEEKRRFRTTFFDNDECTPPPGLVTAHPDYCVYRPKRILAPNDSVSIRLLRGYICDIRENANSISELDSVARRGSPGSIKCIGDSNKGFRTRGEVAVLAKVSERTTAEGAAFARGETAPNDARLIYYSEDIRETGQPPNFTNIPLYGPVKYEGHPLILQMHVVELDEAEAVAQQSLLKSLANLGAAAYPPASSALSVLDKVGSAFLSGQQDDLMFDFLVEFDAGQRPGEPPTSTLSLPLAEGVYVIVRTSDRNRTVPWASMQLDHRSGFVQCREENNTHPRCPIMFGDTGQAEDAHENVLATKRAAFTYFVLQVRRNEREGANTGFQTFQQLLNTPADSKGTDALAASTQEVASALVTETLFDIARTEAANIYSKNIVVRTRARHAFADALCAGRQVVDAAGTSVKLPGIRLSTAQVFYLLNLANEAYETASNGGTGSIDARVTADPEAAQSTCRSTASASIANLFSPPAPDPT